MNINRKHRTGIAISLHGGLALLVVDALAMVMVITCFVKMSLGFREMNSNMDVLAYRLVATVWCLSTELPLKYIGCTGMIRLAGNKVDRLDLSSACKQLTPSAGYWGRLWNIWEQTQQ